MTTARDIKAFCDEARKMGAVDAVVVSPPRQVFTAAWVRLRCQFGCSEFGQCLTCPPHSPAPETTRKVLDEYESAILLHGANWESVRESRGPWNATCSLPATTRRSPSSAVRVGCARPAPSRGKSGAPSPPANTPTRPGRRWRRRGSSNTLTFCIYWFGWSC